MAIIHDNNKMNSNTTPEEPGFPSKQGKMNDTSTAIEKRYREMLLSKNPLERLKMASRMYDSGRKLVISGILKTTPHLDAPRLRAQLFLRMYGSDFSTGDRERIIGKIPNMHLDADR
jgi:hypothetical protein